MENTGSLSESFKSEIDRLSVDTVLTPKYRRRKLIFWGIRTKIAATLYVIFWEYEWVQWTLLVTAPLSAFSLFTIVGTPYLLKRKIARAQAKMQQTDQSQEFNKQ